MIDPAIERQHLAQAERDIAEGEKRVTNQILLIDEMRRDGHDATEAEKYLQTLQETLAAWYDHRDMIWRELERHDALRSR